MRLMIYCEKCGAPLKSTVKAAKAAYIELQVPPCWSCLSGGVVDEDREVGNNLFEKLEGLVGGLKRYREAWETLRAAGMCGGPGGSAMLDLVMSNTEALLEDATREGK